MKRYAYIWFKNMALDYALLNDMVRPGIPAATARKERGKRILECVDVIAAGMGLQRGMTVGDARVLVPEVQVLEHDEYCYTKVLLKLANRCIIYTPAVYTDGADGLILDTSGCTHLWGGELEYIQHVKEAFLLEGYQITMAIAGTIGAAWGICRYGMLNAAVEDSKMEMYVHQLPLQALRLEAETVDELQKLGLFYIKDIVNIPALELAKRFGNKLRMRLEQALGLAEEHREMLVPDKKYEETLYCLEPIRTIEGIEIAVSRLLHTLCSLLEREGKGVRNAILTCMPLDNNVQVVRMGTSRATYDAMHIGGLFSVKLGSIKPGLGIEWFKLEITLAERVKINESRLWDDNKPGLSQQELGVLVDKIYSKLPRSFIRKYKPAKLYWPENSYSLSTELGDSGKAEWVLNRPRPTHLLNEPEPIIVTAPVPDSPPILFSYKNKVHMISRADGPERIERLWWIETGEHRDYYIIEDEDGGRYWVFRSGHYKAGNSRWYLHGFFA